MLGPLKSLLGGRTVVLASASPRRRQLLQDIVRAALSHFHDNAHTLESLASQARALLEAYNGFPVEVVPSHFEENVDKSSFPEPWRYVEETARGKAQEVAQRLREREDWAVVVGADTVVVLDGAILEKPGSPAVAKKMLTSLSGRGHVVYTGLALIWRGGERVCHEATEVTFAPLTSEVIDSYVASGEPLDKAGAYGIQGEGGTLITGVKGDYFNVVGLPLHRLCHELSELLPTT